MQNEQKNKIIDATIRLIENHTTGQPSIREIAKESNVSLGLINYYFKSRDRLIRIAVRRHIEKNVILRFNPTKIKNNTSNKTYIATILLGPLDYIVEHPKLAHTSIINDFLYPEMDDNTYLTFRGIESSLAEIFQRPLIGRERLCIWCIIGSIHEAFLRPDFFKASTDLDLFVQKDRKKYADFLASTILEHFH